MNPNSLLLRQVNPSWIQNGHITSQVFKPTPKDKKKISVYDGDLIQPEDAWYHFTNKLKFQSVGIVAVSVEECETQNLLAKPDPDPFPEHAIIDFSSCTSSNQITTKSKKLKAFAKKRDWLYKLEE